MKYIKLYDNRHDFVFDEQRYFPNTALVNGEETPTYFTDVEEVVFELTVTLPTEKVVTGQTYTLAVEYGGADVFSEATVTTTGDVTLNGTQFTANTDGEFSVTATYDGKTVTLNGTSKLMTAAPTITKYGVSACGIHQIDIVGNGTKTITIDGVESTSTVSTYRKPLYEGDTAHDTVITATAQEEGKWESDVVTATFSIPAAQTFTASLSDTTLEDGQTAQLTVMYGSDDVSISSSVVTRANGDLLVNVLPTFIANYSTGSGSVEVWSTNPNLTHITINVTVAQPQVATNIVFADNDVKTILANAFGSNGEITTAQAAAVTTWFEGGYNNTETNPFCKNESVDSFDEFGTYFTSVSEIGEDAFQECSNMQSITLPSSLTYIPDYAFSGCSSLGSVTIPAAVTYIGYRAFRSCTSLESITIGAGVSSMSTGVFDGCSGLTYMSVDANNATFNDGNGSNVIIDGNNTLLYGGGACSAIPNTAYTIGQSAFSGRHLLNNTITIPSSVTSIGASVFYNCDELTSITIPNSVTSIGNSAFKGCDGLTSVTIGNSVASIGGAAFQNCSALTSVTIPSSVTEIGNDAFNGCTSLSYIIFEGDKPTNLGARAFTNTNDCPIYVPAAYVNNWFNYTERIQANLTVSLSSENIVTGETYTLYVDYCGENVFSNATITSTGDVTISGSSFTANSDGAFSITATYNGYTATLNGTASTPVPVSPNIVFADNDVKSIVTNAYGSNGEITEEQAAAVTTWFRGNASTNPFFQNTSVDSFNEFSYFTSVTEIGTSAFYGCRNMTSITIPENVTSIRERAFDYCYLLGSITIPDSVTYIGRAAFQACTGLTTLNLGSYVETIDIYAFKGCSSLTSVNIPDSVTTLGEEAFNSCTNLNTVTIGKSVSAIPSAAIPRTISYVSVSSQNNTYDSRDNCNGIVETSTNKLILGCKNTVIPSTVTYIGDYGFRGCTGLTSVTIPANVTSIGGYTFNGCSGLTSVTIPDSVTSIGPSAFQYCSGLTSVTIGNSVTSIGSFAFSSCTGLTSLTIPASVTSIAGSVFRNCSGLTSITCEATTPPTLGSYVFDGTNDCPIYVPSTSLDTYKTAWSDYASRIHPFGVTVSLSAESIVTGETYTLKVTHNGVDVLSNATVTSTGDVTISGSSFIANSDGAFSITATYNGYTVTLNGTASTYEPNPEYAVAVLDCSDLEDANPLQTCANCDPEGEVPEGLNTLDCNFDGEVSYVENGVITIPTSGWLGSVGVTTADTTENSKVIDYIKLTHPSAEYKLNADTEVGDPLSFTCDVSFNSTTLTTTIYNFVSLDEFVFDGSNFQLLNLGSTDIKITRIEVCYLPDIEEEPAEE